MQTRLYLTGLAVLAGLWSCARPPEPGFGIAIHGGAGVITRAGLTPESEREYRAKLEEALRAGYAVLEEGGRSLDAVTTAVTILEDSPLFNAGRGAVFNARGYNELDAAIMDGRTHGAGAVAGVRRIRNPIRLARLVMERSPHVLLAGEGAEIFAREQEMPLAEADYFYTERRWQALERARRRAAEGAVRTHGTVGAVALDRHGDLSAGTSTGGLTNKSPGRIGDSPLIGAGTYAGNATCAISATGQGEYFIRGVVAHDIAALMEYRGLSLQAAAETVILDKLTASGGTGGIIGIDARGRISAVFNTPGMYRGYMQAPGRPVVEIFRE